MFVGGSPVAPEPDTRGTYGRLRRTALVRDGESTRGDRSEPNEEPPGLGLFGIAAVGKVGYVGLAGDDLATSSTTLSSTATASDVVNDWVMTCGAYCAARLSTTT